MAIYSDKHRLVFIHIPKCGGTSVSRWLTNLGAMQRGNKHDGMQHIHFDCLDYASIAVVRNPWARLVSWFHYDTKINENKVARGKGKGEYETQHKICQLGFNYWLNWGLDYKNTWFKHKTPQSNWIQANPTYLFKLESINKEFKQIQSLVNCDLPLQTKNSTDHAHYKEYYDSKTMNIVGDLYRKDVERFNYDF